MTLSTNNNENKAAQNEAIKSDLRPNQQSKQVSEEKADNNIAQSEAIVQATAQDMNMVTIKGNINHSKTQFGYTIRTPKRLDL